MMTANVITTLHHRYFTYLSITFNYYIVDSIFDLSSDSLQKYLQNSNCYIAVNDSCLEKVRMFLDFIVHRLVVVLDYRKVYKI
jgi:hypothetical protein